MKKQKELLKRVEEIAKEHGLPHSEMEIIAYSIIYSQAIIDETEIMLEKYK